MASHTVEGKHGIKATVLKRSYSAGTGIEFITFEIEYPRIVLAELNTHRMLSKNSFSSRAVPFTKMLEQLNGRPVRFGANQAGMQDKGEDFNAPVHAGYSPEEWWKLAKLSAIRFASELHEAGYHKQTYNRLLEPWQMMKTIISGTEWANFFWLRDDEAADPTLRELARTMLEARKVSDSQVLQPGEWHLPYLDTWRDKVTGELHYGDWFHDEFQEYALEDAIKVSCARCAAVSYRNEGYGLEKSLEVYDRLVGSEKKHASAFEHCGTPAQDAIGEFGIAVNCPSFTETWEDGITHMDREGNLWSGNLRGWIQYRKLIPGENYTGG